MSIFTYENNEIFYQLDGELDKDKEIIVILNGIMMSTASWEIFKEAFSKDNVLLRFDMFDQGQSAKLDYQYTQKTQVKLLKALLDHLSFEEVNVVGISYGASVALQFTAAYPKMVKKQVIANGVAKTSPWLKAIGDGWNQVAKNRDGEAYYNITIPYIYSPQFYTEQLEWMENRKRVLIPIFSNAIFLDAMERLTISAETHNVVSSLANMKNNTLIIASEQDYLTPVYEQRFIHSSLENSKLVVIPQCGHASMYEVPELFTSLVLGFVNNTSKEFKI